MLPVIPTKMVLTSKFESKITYFIALELDNLNQEENGLYVAICIYKIKNKNKNTVLHSK